MPEPKHHGVSGPVQGPLHGSVALADHEGGLALPPFVPLLSQPEPPAYGAGSQEAQAGGQQHQPQHRDGGAVRVKGVGHRRHHDARDEDDHPERHRAAVAGHVGAAGGRRQLDLVDVWDVPGHDDDLVPAQLLGRDGRWRLRGALGNPGTPFGVQVVWHCDFTGKEEMGHVGTDVSRHRKLS